VGGLGHIIERTGLATTQISLIREHTEKIQPPRALWVPFDLGRPFGVPNDADFQTDVLRSVLGLLEQSGKPLMADYEREAPSTPDDPGAWSCPVQIPAPAPETELEALTQSLLSEVRLLHPWYDEGLKARGRTAFGVTGKDVGAVEEMATVVTEAASGAEVSPDGYIQEMPLLLKYIADDLKTFYYEAAAAQPGATPTVKDLNDWFFTGTRLGSDVLYQLVEQFGSLGRAVIPIEYARASE
jgi:hypothetical protein